MRQAHLSTPLIIITLFLTLIAPLRAGGGSADQKMAAPTAAELDAAEKLVKDTFADEFQKAKTPELKRALADRLLKAATDTKDDRAGRYMLYRQARDLSAEAGDIRAAIGAVEEIAVAYRVDIVRLKSEAINAAAKSAHAEAQQKAVAEAALAVTDEAIHAEQYDAAAKLANSAATMARNANDTALLRLTGTRLREIEDVRKAAPAAEKAANLLKQSPDDAAANAILGEFTCLQKGDWERGLPLLAKGNNAALSQPATADLSAPSAAPAQTEVGDAWWTLADKRDGIAKRQLRARAAYWYAKAAPALTGLQKARIEKRLTETTVSASQLAGAPITDPRKKALVNAIAMKLVLVPSGKFLMGSPETEKGRNPPEEIQHEVTISKPFYMGIFEVTQIEYFRVMNINPSVFQTGKNNNRIDTRMYPVQNVSYEDATEFCKKLSEMPEEKRQGHVYRLPTEAEWEYACRAGTKTTFYCGDTISNKLANAMDGPKQPTPVGSYPPNAWGIFDMQGNVSEWCLDEERHYDTKPQVDPRGSMNSGGRALRGAHYGNSEARSLRSAARIRRDLVNHEFEYGFRVIMETAAAEQPATPRK